MAAVTRSQFVALIPTDNRLTDPASSLWSTHTSVTQAGPTAGVPEAQGSYDLILQASGTQTASTSLTTQIVRGGMPDASAQSGEIVWRYTTDGSNDYRGWEQPISTSSWEPVGWVSSGATDERVHPHAVTLSSGTVLCAVEYWDGSTGGHGISAYIRDVATGIWGRVAIFDPSTSSDERGYWPCLVVAEDRIMCFAWVHNPNYGDDRMRVRCWTSTDSGLTWRMTSRQCTTDTTTYVSTAAGSASVFWAGRLRGAYNNGQVLLIAHCRRSILGATALGDIAFQWASGDLGQSLTLIYQGTGDTVTPSNFAGHDIIPYGGGFAISFCSGDSDIVNAELYVSRITSAYQSIASTTHNLVMSNVAAFALDATSGNAQMTNPESALVADESGTLWCYGKTATEVKLSRDGGLTWNTAGLSGVDCWSSVTRRHFCAVFQRGRVLLLSNYSAATATNDNSLIVSYLGGWSQFAQPYLDAPSLVVNIQQQFDVGHNPAQLAQNCGWTATTAGTSSTSLTGSGRERITAGDGAGASGSIYNTKSEAHAETKQGAIIQWSSYAVQGGSTSFNRVATRIRLGNATAGGEITIRQLNTAFAAVDGAGNSLLSVTGLTSAAVQFRVGMYAKTTGTPTLQCVIAYRMHDASDDRQWTISGVLTVADDGGAGGDFFIVDFGCLAPASGGSTQVIGDWYDGPYYTADDAGTRSALTMSDGAWWAWVKASHNPTLLTGKGLASVAGYLGAGVSVAAVDGPAFAGDTHTIETRYRYPIENVWPEVARSPRTGWRSTTLAQHDIAWKLSPGLVTVTHRPEGAYTAITLRGINWRTATLSYSDAPASFVSMISIDAASGMSGLTFTRTGATIRANSAGTSLYFAENELAGFTVDLGSSVYRRILGNSEGMWTSSGDFPRCVIQLESAAGTDPASGAALSIWSTEVTAYISSQNAIGYRLRIDAQTTVDGYLAIGEARIGPMLILGKSPAAERQVEFVPGVQIDDLADGSTRAALVAPGRRTVDIAWTDGVRTDEFHGTRSAYVRATASGGVGSPSIPAATPYSLEGLMRRIGTGYVTYLPRVVYGTDSAIFNRRHQHVTGTLGDRVRVETTNAKAAENSTEFVRIATVKIREEV